MSDPVSPTPACADQAGAGIQYIGPRTTVSTETAEETLRIMRAEYNALDRWLSAYKALVAQQERTKDELEAAIRGLEKEVDG